MVMMVIFLTVREESQILNVSFETIHIVKPKCMKSSG